LIIPKMFVETLLLSPLFDVIKSSRFKQAVADMPGYDVNGMGILVAEV